MAQSTNPNECCEFVSRSWIHSTQLGRRFTETASEPKRCTQVANREFLTIENFRRDWLIAVVNVKCDIHMSTHLHYGLAVVLAMVAGCTHRQGQALWRVEKLEIPLYHSSTSDPASGAMAHVEYCAARLSRGQEVFHVVYRPIDYPERNPASPRVVLLPWKEPKRRRTLVRSMVWIIGS